MVQFSWLVGCCGFCTDCGYDWFFIDWSAGWLPWNLLWLQLYLYVCICLLAGCLVFLLLAMDFALATILFYISLPGWLAGCLSGWDGLGVLFNFNWFFIVWLAGCLVGCNASFIIGWLVGWLAGTAGVAAAAFIASAVIAVELQRDVMWCNAAQTKVFFSMLIVFNQNYLRLNWAN